MNALLIGSFVWAQVLIPGKTPVQQFGINDKGETVVTNSDNSSGIWVGANCPDTYYGVSKKVSGFAAREDELSYIYPASISK